MSTQPTSQPADDAHAGTPNYDKFGKADGQPTKPAAQNSGHNDNPDEFSEFRKGEDNPTSTGTEDYSPDAAQVDPRDQKGHVEQNQDPAIVRASQDADEDVQRAAWAKDDPRYAGGGTNNEAFDEKPA